jgi:hypothetical protein
VAGAGRRGAVGRAVHRGAGGSDGGKGELR